MPASTLRRIHAFLLNLAVLTVPVHLIASVINPMFAGAISFVVVLVLSVLLPASLSPGHRILSIQPDKTVDDEVLSGESWVTMLLGLVFVECGANTTLSWTRLDDLLAQAHLDGIPFFGTLIDPTYGAAISTSWGLITVLAGVLFYKLSPVGLWLGVAIVLINATDLFVSREGWINIYFSWFFANQPPESPLAGGTFSAPTIAYELTPWFVAVLGTGSAVAISAMVLTSGRLTRTG
ncbi:MAG TPA: hypothetical protein VGQ35_08905 [Dongiaceae bacterium]|nr:hypothetical protein [Dongiaceae bacterium]